MTALVSVIPILLLIVLMMGFKVSGFKSAIVTLIVTIILALFATPSLDIFKGSYEEPSIFSKINTKDGKKGVMATYYSNMNHEGTPCATGVISKANDMRTGGKSEFAIQVPKEKYSASYEGLFNASKDEEIKVNLQFKDKVRLSWNEETVFDGSNNGDSIQIVEKTFNVKAGEQYPIKIDYAQSKEEGELKFNISHKVNITDVTIWSVIEGFLRACFPIILIIIFAIFSYNILCETKEIETIKSQFISLTSDKGLLVLLLTWGLGGVLEGMAGFGTAVAIPAAILISLGFKPMFSAVICLIANTVAVGFGAVGLPATTLANQVAASGTADSAMLCEVATFIIIQLALMFFITPFLILMMTDRKKIWKNLSLALFVGTFSIIVQFCCAHFIGPETPAILGSVAAIIAMLIYNKLFIKKEERTDDTVKVEKKSFGLSKTLKAWSVYGLIIFFILISSKILPSINQFLDKTLVTQFEFPVIGKDFKFGWISNAGLMIFLGAIIGGMIQGLSFGKLMKILAKTIINLQKTIVTICCLVAMAMLMNNTGMTNDIANGLVALTGSVFPFFAPLIGSIGTFVTGSATNANILFGKLQATAAGKLGLVNQGTFFGVSGNETNWLAAANCAGSEGGKLLSPQSIAIATAACDMEGQDGEIMRKTMPFAIFWILMNGLMVFLGLHVF